MGHAGGSVPSRCASFNDNHNIGSFLPQSRARQQASPLCYIDPLADSFYLAVMRQTSGTAFFRSFSDTLARAFRWQKGSASRVSPTAEAERNKRTTPVLSAPRPWLTALSWEKVLNFNHSQCQLQSVQPTPNRESYDTVQRLWEAALGQPMSLVKALDLCKQCHDKAPFVFSNSVTFCLVAKAIVEDLVKDVPQVEAHIVRTTVSNYISGRVSKRELMEILRIYESKWCLLAHAAGNGHIEAPLNG
jgi:hypothetical protein